MCENLSIPNVKDTADSVRGILEAVPIYQDLIQPSTQELGKGLQTVAKTIHIALAPISALIWGYDKIKEYIVPALEERLKNIPNEKIITPDPVIAGPALESLRFAGHKEDLRELYVNLLASSMCIDTAYKAHPSFVEILKQLTPDEAKLLSYLNINTSYPMIKIRAKNINNIAYGEVLIDFSLLPYLANCNFPELGPSYLKNLSRLGILDLSYTQYVINPSNSYDSINNHPQITYICDKIKEGNRNPEIIQGAINFTELGRNFYKACIC